MNNDPNVPDCVKVGEKLDQIGEVLAQLPDDQPIWIGFAPEDAVTYLVILCCLNFDHLSDNSKDFLKKAIEAIFKGLIKRDYRFGELLSDEVDIALSRLK